MAKADEQDEFEEKDELDQEDDLDKDPLDDDELDDEKPSKENDEFEEDLESETEEVEQVNDDPSPDDEIVSEEREEAVETFRRPAEPINDEFEASEDEETALSGTEFAQRKPMQAETMDDLADDTRSDLKIPSLRSQVPSSGIYSSHNQNFSQGSGYRPSTPGSRTTSKKHLLILAVLGIAVIAGTVYTLKSQFGSDSASPSPTPQDIVITSSPEPTSTPAPEITRGDYTVRVLNGTSTSGLAGDVLAALVEKGYKKDKSANATNSAFERTVVRVKDGQDSLLQALIADLAPDHDAEAGPALSKSDSVDVEVILGTR